MNRLEIVPGNIVYLKSGSPPMTVRKVKGQIVTVVWMSLAPDTFRGCFKIETFPISCLTKEQPPCKK